jgi:hypothetical protein
MLRHYAMPVGAGFWNLGAYPGEGDERADEERGEVVDRLDDEDKRDEQREDLIREPAQTNTDRPKETRTEKRQANHATCAGIHKCTGT